MASYLLKERLKEVAVRSNLAGERICLGIYGLLWGFALMLNSPHDFSQDNHFYVHIILSVLIILHSLFKLWNVLISDTIPIIESIWGIALWSASLWLSFYHNTLDICLLLIPALFLSWWLFVRSVAAIAVNDHPRNRFDQTIQKYLGGDGKW